MLKMLDIDFFMVLGGSVLTYTYISKFEIVLIITARFCNLPHPKESAKAKINIARRRARIKGEEVLWSRALTTFCKIIGVIGSLASFLIALKHFLHNKVLCYVIEISQFECKAE